MYYLLRTTDHQIVKTFATLGLETSGMFVPDSRRILLSGGSLSMLDPLKGTVLERFVRPGESYGRAAFTPAGNRAIVPVSPGGILVLDMLDPGCVLPVRGVFNLYSGDGTLDDERQVQPLVAEGGVEFVPGVIGRAFHFNGKDSLLRSTHFGACGDCGDSWSESLFVKFSALAGKMAILEHVRSAEDPEIRLLKSGDNRIVLEVGDRCLHDQRSSLLGGEALRNATNRFDLIKPVSDGGINRDLREFLLSAALVNAVLQTVFGIEAKDGARRIPLSVVPDRNFVTIGGEDHRALAVFRLERIGIQRGLFAARLPIAGSLFRFHHS